MTDSVYFLPITDPSSLKTSKEDDTRGLSHVGGEEDDIPWGFKSSVAIAIILAIAMIVLLLRRIEVPTFLD